MRVRVCLVFSVLGLLLAEQAQAENLHKKFGAGWDCSFITTGLPYKDTCAACEQRGMEFDLQNGAGNCVAKEGGSGSAKFPSPGEADYSNHGTTSDDEDFEPSTRASPPAKATAITRWNAVAGITHKSGNGRIRSSVGYAEGKSPDEAKSRAVSACSENGVPGCKALGAWNSGCVYITTGSGETRREVNAGYAGAATRDGALSKCRKTFDTCKPPIGGCVD